MAHWMYVKDISLDERGANRSGGQCQRIAIVRALLKDAPILLLALVMAEGAFSRLVATGLES